MQVVIDRLVFSVYLFLHYYKIILRHSAFYLWALRIPICLHLFAPDGPINKYLPDTLSEYHALKRVQPVHPIIALFLIPFMLLAMATWAAANTLSWLARVLLALLQGLLAVILAVLAVIPLLLTSTFSRFWWKDNFKYGKSEQWSAKRVLNAAKRVFAHWLPSTRGDLEPTNPPAASSFGSWGTPLTLWVREFQGRMRAMDLAMFHYFVPSASMLGLRWNADTCTWETVGT
jgi:hypothetical protein